MADKSWKRHRNSLIARIPKETKSASEMRSAAGSAIKVSMYPGTICAVVHLAHGTASLLRGPATHAHPMKLILDLLRWLRQRDQREPDAGAVGGSDDRSSMADFVRLLRMHDDAAQRSSHPD